MGTISYAYLLCDIKVPLLLCIHTVKTLRFICLYWHVFILKYCFFSNCIFIIYYKFIFKLCYDKKKIISYITLLI